MFTTIAIVVAILTAFLFVYVSTRPDTFQIVRTASIKARPEKIYPLINDLRAFNTWNPFALQDPQLKLSYAGTTSGKGAAYNWEGPKAGVGRMEITDTAVPSKVSIKLDFSKPFEAHNLVDFTVEGKGESSDVTWKMYGPMTFMTKFMGLFFSMDAVVGKEFEKGLANLKVLAEK
jgi:hypothetical protein